MSASGAEDRGSSPRGGTALLGPLLLALLVSACAPATPAVPPPIVRSALVRIPAFRFEPARLDVGRGTVVVWENDDDARHVIANSPSAAIPLNADGSYDLRGSRFTLTVDPGERASFAFNEAGTYYYFCLVHNTMRGVVVVR